MPNQILIVDDDRPFSKEVAAFLAELGYRAHPCYSLSEARKVLKASQPDLVLLDLNLPDGSGMDLLPEVLHEPGETPVIILSGYGTIPVAVEAIKRGAEDFLTKPVDPEHLRIIVERVLERRRLRNRMVLAELERSGGEILLGDSPAMREVISLCEAAAATDTAVLLTGETGTGKQVLARLIHAKSARRDRPFVYVNCATLTENLLESELFGHERGAFTGAHRQKRGRAELADGGTLFLDEIAELTPPVQAKLLHFIEYGEFTRLGGTVPLHPDIRLLCATNRNLQERVAQGLFREDLYYRIHVLHIHVPPLRERREDIPLFLNHFIRHFSRNLNRPEPTLAPGLLEKLQAYSWPGNVRELRNAVERAIILARGSELRESDFPFLREPAPEPESGLFRPRPLKQAVNDFKKAFIGRVLESTGGNQTQAAKILGIQRTYLNQLLRGDRLD